MIRTNVSGLVGGCALLLSACSSGGEGKPDVDQDGVPDDQDEFVDLDGDGVDDRGGTGGTPGTGAGTGGGAPGSGGSGAQPVGPCMPGVPSTSQVPRLKNSEYDRTVRDLLGVTGLTAEGGVAPSSLLATDQSGSLSDLGWSSYQTVGEKIVQQVMADPQLRSHFMDCDPAAEGCLDSTIVDFGRRAFRRPLRDEEVAQFQKLADPALTENGTPQEVAELVLYGFMVSPSFLMRAEIQEETTTAGNYSLSSHEVASRLSYMLWGSMPDAELNDLADASMLSDRDQVLAQAKRMLLDPKARDVVAEFHREYLHIRPNSRWDTFVKEPTRFPAFNEALRGPMTSEMEMFFEHTVFENGTFQDLFLSTTGFVNGDTAALYGVEAPSGEGLTRVELPGRPGFLTRLGFLNAYSAASRTSPIVRGAFIVKDVLGIEPGAPPPGAADTPLPEGPELLTNRARVDQQTSAANCVRCHHEYINPPGFVLEGFDTMGIPQTQEAETGAPIDTAASVFIDGASVPVSDPVDLMSQLASSSDAAHYYAQKWVGYAFKRSVNAYDACVVEALTAKIGEGDYTILNLIADITQAESFLVRKVEGGAQ